MALDANDLFSGRSRMGNESSSNSAGGYSGLFHAIYPGVGYFTFDGPGKYQEPAHYPVFNVNNDFSTKIKANDITAKSSSSLTNSYYGRNSMTTIRVDPDILLNCSQTLGNSATTLNSVNSNLAACGNSAPRYGNDNFDTQIRRIVSEMSPTGTTLSSRFSFLNGRLSSKARQFLDADGASSAAMGLQFNNLSWMSPPNLPRESRAIPISSLGNASVIPGTATVRVPLEFRGISSKDGKSIKIPKGEKLTTINERSILDGKWWIKVKNSKGEVGWVEEDKLIIKIQDPFASEVPAGIADNGGRYHHSFGGSPMNSNCTYYVAAAVKKFSGGNIDLQKEPFTDQGQGDGGNWANEAREKMGPTLSFDPRIEDVNKTPEVGSIFCNPSGVGHVAFVQGVTEIKNENGIITGFRITLSEENYPSGNAINSDNPISISKVDNITGDTTPNSSVGRYIRVLEIKKDDPRFDFIHLDYSYKKP
jgi:surface antigen